MEPLYPLVWIAFIICIFLAWYFSHRAKHKERMMMIEKGLIPGQPEKNETGSDANELLRKRKAFSFPWLKIGVVVIGLSVGLLLIAVLVALNLLNKGGNALPLSILGICGGASMVIAGNSNKHKSKS